MNEKNSVSIAEWTAKSRKLLESVRALLGEIGFDESAMPQSIFDGNKPISLVFAGQYSAGKSTILKSLTGISDIAVGAGITTQKAHSYDWNGIKVIDTPGIHTSLRPDHDEISYQAIASSDVLVYVVTQELFDDFIGQNFRKLLLEKDKASEMILIVNKMADIGNTIENQEIKLKDLEKVTTPYPPSQLRTVFVDANSYLESLSESDIEIAEELRVRSNYDVLVSTLNNFVRDNGLFSQITTVLYELLEFLQNTLKEYRPPTGDSISYFEEDHLLKERHIISDTQWRIKNTVKSLFTSAASEIRAKGREIATSIYDYDNEEDANEALTTAYNEVNRINSDCINSVTQKIEELSKECQTELDAFYESDFSKELKFRLESNRAKSNSLTERIAESDILNQGSSKIASNTVGTNATANGLKAFTGSNMHQTVLDIGHFFGHSFKPWEAVKWVKGINAAGKALGTFAILLSFGMQAKEDMAADKRALELKRARESIRAGFNNAADEVVKHFNNALENFLLENYDTKIKEIDSQIAEIRNMRLEKSEIYNLLESSAIDCRRLIADIHQSDIVKQ